MVHFLQHTTHLLVQESVMRSILFIFFLPVALAIRDIVHVKLPCGFACEKNPLSALVIDGLVKHHSCQGPASRCGECCAARGLAGGLGRDHVNGIPSGRNDCLCCYESKPLSEHYQGCLSLLPLLSRVWFIFASLLLDAYSTLAKSVMHLILLAVILPTVLVTSNEITFTRSIECGFTCEKSPLLTQTVDNVEGQYQCRGPAPDTCSSCCEMRAMSAHLMRDRAYGVVAGNECICCYNNGFC
ncbi:hypothetical protein Q1695_005363 [Nippostrongylus brasiliensis]|nr:hypothetical protein Q1695_005363 [Nippostrongylus brasiliensis]